MIPIMQPITSLTGGLIESRAVSIEANAIAFRSLIDGIYSNKIAAIIRELGTNAIDSHIERGIPDRPIEIQLPTLMDPTFSVRDYGISMSHETVMTLYSTLFGSSKRNSDEVAGMLGLGSKSFYAYTSNATITCILDGEMRVYSCYLNEDGVPHVGLMHAGPTDEEQGVIVSVPVRKEDVRAFHDEAHLPLMAFRPRPVILNPDFVWKFNDPVMEGTTWAYHAGMSSSYAVQGGVVYPLDQTQVRDIWGVTGLILRFDVGQIEFTTSREQLAYSPTTVRRIEERMAQVRQETAAKIEAALKKADSFLDACYLYQRFYSDVLRPLRTYMSTPTWRGQSVSTRPFDTNQLGYRFRVPNKDEARDFPLNWRLPKYANSPDLSELTKAVFLYEPEGLDKSTQRVRNLVHTGKLEEGTVVYWTRNKPKLADLTYIDLDTVEPLPPRPATKRGGRKKTEGEGAFVRWVDRYGNFEGRVQLFDGMIVVPAPTVETIQMASSNRTLVDRAQLSDNVRSLIRVGFLPEDAKVYLMPDQLKARIERENIKVVLLENHVRDRLKATYDLSVCQEYCHDIDRAHRFQIYLEDRTDLGDRLTAFRTEMAKWSKRPRTSLEWSILRTFARDLILEDSPLWKSDDNPWVTLNTALPLLSHIPQDKLDYYLKLEGELQ